jgi:hypothetical protein
MLGADFVYLFSPSTILLLFQMSATKASKRTAGVHLNLIKNTDVNQSLSARNRTEMRLLPEFQAGEAGDLQPDPAGANQEVGDSMEKPLDLPTTNERRSMAIMARDCSELTPHSNSLCRVNPGSRNGIPQ